KRPAILSGLDVEVLHPHLLNPLQILIADVFVHLHGDLDAWRQRLQALGGGRRCESGCRYSCFSEISPGQVIHVSAPSSKDHTPVLMARPPVPKPAFSRPLPSPARATPR